MKNIIYTVYTVDGKEWESTVMELKDGELEPAREICRNAGSLSHLAFDVNDAFGRKATMFFPGDKIVAMRLTEVEG